MCGIAGIVKVDPREHVEAGRLALMSHVLKHRGPDGEGTFIDGCAGLAHRRLAIVDVNAGAQPMSNEDGSIWVVFNGEIYNHAALRTDLEGRGHGYRTRCDTETILHLYEEYGDAAVEHLHGMFAFAIWDRRRERLLMARDRLGIKPLYYTWTGEELVFASEIKALLVARAVRPAFNEDVLPEFLSTRFVSGEETFFQGVRKLLPAHTASWSRGEGFQTRQYWTLPQPAVDPSPGTIVSQAPEVRARLEAAVRSHLMSDVPLGVFLSGGIDSSVLAALVAREAKGPIQTFAVGFEEREANELEYARLVADRIGSTHRQVLVSAAEFFQALPQLLWQEDEPIAFTSSIPLYFVARLARDHVKVVLTGEGADELFLGYNRYRATYWNTRLGEPYWSAVPKSARDGVKRLVTGLPQAVRRYADRSFFAHDPGIRGLFYENFAVFADRARQDLLLRSPASGSRDPYHIGLGHYEHASGNVLDRMGRADLHTYLQELLMKQDQMSMAASIESRVPFLDDHLVEYVASLPARFKLDGLQTKAVLRAGVADLVPPSILTRPKMGFPVPIGRWLKDGFSGLVDEFVLGGRAQSRHLFRPQALQRLVEEHRTGRQRHGERLWLLINLEMWFRIFCEGERPDEILRRIPRHRQRSVYANPLGKDGRAVSGEYRRTRAQPADHLGALAAPSPHAGDNART